MKPKRKGKLEYHVFQSNAFGYGDPTGGHWYFRIKAGNGQIVAASEGYTRKADAVRGAKRLMAR
jgi:uncharacterized protein YegP (UPF0339 family)